MAEMQPSFEFSRTTTQVAGTAEAELLDPEDLGAESTNTGVQPTPHRGSMGASWRIIFFGENRNVDSRMSSRAELPNKRNSTCGQPIMKRLILCSCYLRPDWLSRGKGVWAIGRAPSTRWLQTVLAGLVVWISMPQQAQAAVDAVAVQRAIDRGIAYLRKTQNDRGGWTEFSGQSCGLSALCTLALLNSGVSNDDADMVRAIRYLREFEPRETYSVALQTLVYCQLGAAGDLPRIRRNVEWLIANQKMGDPMVNRGGAPGITAAVAGAATHPTRSSRSWLSAPPMIGESRSTRTSFVGRLPIGCRGNARAVGEHERGLRLKKQPV